jgi:hypothetical protein
MASVPKEASRFMSFPTADARQVLEGAQSGNSFKPVSM